MATPKTWRTVEITQDCSYGWTEDNVKKFLSDWSPIKDYAYIIHDKDKQDDNLTPRDAHIHVMLRFTSPVPTTAIIARAKAVGCPDDCIKPERLEKCKSWSGAINYLTHRDEHKPYKHIYDKAEVHSNFDWELAAESAHQKKLLHTSPERCKQIVEEIDKGIIREYNIHDKLTAWEEVQYSGQIAKAFRRYIDREKLKGERDMEVMFVSGASGVGKDAFAADWCEKNRLVYFRTNNNDTHPFDDYKGQPAIIWSDARDDVYKPAQLFALLDNHWKSAQKARYSDINLDCKALIITSIKPLDEWYKSAFEADNEPRKQLFRRIKTWVEITPDWLYIKVYNQAAECYKVVTKIPNSFMHSNDYLDTPEKMIEFAKMMFSGYTNAMQDALDYAKENVPDAYNKAKDDMQKNALTVGDLMQSLNSGLLPSDDDDGLPF